MLLRTPTHPPVVPIFPTRCSGRTARFLRHADDRSPEIPLALPYRNPPLSFFVSLRPTPAPVGGTPFLCREDGPPFQKARGPLHKPEPPPATSARTSKPAPARSV